MQRLGEFGRARRTQVAATGTVALRPRNRLAYPECARPRAQQRSTLQRLGNSDAPHRTLKNKTFAEWVAAGSSPRGSKPGEGTSIGHRTNPIGKRVDWMRYSIGTAPADFDGDIEYTPLWAGESCSVVNDIKPAGWIVSDLVREAEAELAG